jgi:probable HAF family extracellular repeat protein
MVVLGTLGGNLSGANAVNNRGEVVGVSRTASGQLRAFVWTARSGMLELPTLGGESVAVAINERGDITGSSDNAAGVQRAALWRR